MKICCKKAPCWQNMNLGNNFTLPTTPSLGSEWSGRAFPPGTHIKDKLHLLNQKQVITAISFLITSLNPSWVLFSYVYEWNVLKPQHLLPFRRAALLRDNAAIYDQPFHNGFLLSQDILAPENYFILTAIQTKWLLIPSPRSPKAKCASSLCCCPEPMAAPAQTLPGLGTAAKHWLDPACHRLLGSAAHIGVSVRWSIECAHTHTRRYLQTRDYFTHQTSRLLWQMLCKQSK